VVLGDSLSAGFGIDTQSSWVSLLKTRLSEKNYPYEVINASISGDTSSGGLNRIQRTLPKNKPPGILILELGANDGLRGLSLKEMKKNLSAIVKFALDKKYRVLIIGMRLPPNYGLSFANMFSSTFNELAQEHDIAYLPFLFEGIASNSDYFLSDQLHPNEKAQPLLLNNVWLHLKPLL